MCRIVLSRSPDPYSLDSLKNTPLEKWPDNCASRTTEALNLAGIDLINTGFPQHLMMQLYLLHNLQSIYIPQNSTTISPLLNTFNPQ